MDTHHQSTWTDMKNLKNYQRFLSLSILVTAMTIWWLRLRIFNVVQSFNPNWTRRGQSWPCQLWPQIAGKLIKYFIFFLYLFLQKRLPDLFELLTWPQKMMFWHLFWCISVRSKAAESSAAPPPSARFYWIYSRFERGRSSAGPWSAVRCGAS